MPNTVGRRAFLKTAGAGVGACPAKKTLERLEQLRKAPLAMLVTLLGIVTLLRSMQKANASTPILVIFVPKVTLFRLVSLKNA